MKTHSSNGRTLYVPRGISRLLLELMDPTQQANCCHAQLRIHELSNDKITIIEWRKAHADREIDPFVDDVYEVIRAFKHHLDGRVRLQIYRPSDFSHATGGTHISPFLPLDYAGSADFLPARKARGVGTHSHRGFDTVTILFKGKVEHRDSAGNGGIIGPGDVQWMIAVAGILHKEQHSETLSRSGGVLEMVQLWVNLLAKDKNAKPGYR